MRETLDNPGDIPAAVAGLKGSSDTSLVIMGSGVLIGSLMASDLIDEYLLMIHPFGARHRTAAVSRRHASIAAADRQHDHEHGRVDRTYEAARGYETKLSRQAQAERPAPGRRRSCAREE
jgi:dihydrofolate reductase